MSLNGFFRIGNLFRRFVLLWIAALVLSVPVNSWAAVPGISSGSNHTAVIQSNGTLWGWGANTYGQIGDGTNIDRFSPVQIGSGTDWAAVAAGKFFTVAVKSDGTLWTWGANGYGQLGDGTLIDRNAPVQIGTDSNWVSVAAGVFHAVALKSDGTIWTWGRNQAGEIGNGTKILQPYPVQVGTDSDWIAIAAGSSHTVAIKTNGSLWSWGANGYGQLGDGTTNQSSVPIRTGSDSNWSAVTAGNKHTLALKSDGSLWAWGDNEFGQLGIAGTANTLVPLQVGTDLNWTSVSGGKSHSLALKSDNTLWAWGLNANGQLGDGTIFNSSVPIPIGSGTEWKAASAGEAHSSALSSENAVWTWGNNLNGQLGDGTNQDKSSPALIGIYTVTPSSGPNGSISPSTPQNAPWGSTVSFTITPDEGYRIDSVSGCNGTLSAGVYTTAPITAECTVTFTFEIKTYNVTATAGTNGSITPSGTLVITHGSTVWYTVNPNEGYRIDSIFGCNGTLAGNIYTTEPIKADCTVTASFVIKTYTIGATAGANGTISPSGSVVVTHGSNKTFTMTPSSGYHVEQVVVDGLVVGPVSAQTAGAPLSQPYTYTFNNVTSSRTISATFAANPTVIIAASAGAGGTITPSGQVAVLSETDKTFTIVPDAGYHVEQVLVDGSVVPGLGVTTPPLSRTVTYTFTNITAAHTINASFAPNPAVTITASAGANGSITPSGQVSVLTESNKSFTMTPASGYHVEQVVVDGAVFGPTLVVGPPWSDPYTYTFTNVTSPHTISATFAPNPTFIITATAAGGGSISPSGEVAVLGETNKTFTITSNSGYQAAVVVDGVSQGALNSYTFVNVTSNHTISVNFSITIVSSAGQNGSISPRGTTIVANGTDATYTITPNAGYHVEDVVVDGASTGISVSDYPLTRPVSYTFTNVTAPHTISATFAANPTYIITASAGANGTINPSGEVAVLSETNKSFTITANTGYRTDSVVVDGVNMGTLGFYTFSNITANHTISAAFSPTITASAGANGSISPRGTLAVDSGTDMTFTITPNAGYHVEDVIVDGVSSGISVTDSPLSRSVSYTFTNVTVPHMITATFAANPTYIITAVAGPNGSINPSGEVAVLAETSKSFTMTADTGYKITSVVVNGVNQGTTAFYTFSNVNTNHSISVTFAPTITSTAGPNGSISPRGTMLVASGTDAAYTITPNSGYHVDDVLVDNVSAGPVTSYTFTNVTTPHTISATFAANPTYIITATAGPNGTINPSGDISVLAGTSKNFTMTADSGYKISSVLVDGVNQGTTSFYTFSNVNANHTITVTFSPTITATAGANGTIAPRGTTIVASGSDVTYTITPNSGYHVDDVLADNVSVGPVTSYTFTNVTTPHTISATFAANPTYIISATADGSGTISPSGDVSVLGGTNKSFTMTAASGFKISSVVVDGVNQGTSSFYTFTNVSANHTITVTFSPTIVSTAGSNGTISPRGTIVVPTGTDMSYTITSYSGYHVNDVLVDNVSVGPVTSYTFTNVTTPHTISASFAAN